MNTWDRVLRGGIVMTLLLSALTLADDARELDWKELIPERSSPEQSVYALGVVDELNGVQAKLPGFIVPLELAGDGKLKEFLLVPYFGACIHYPPPPANQIVYVKLDEPVELETTWDPIWAIGELKTEFHESDLGSAGYTMMAQTIEIYEY